MTGPADNPADDYRRLAAELAWAQSRYGIESAGAEKSYVDGCAAVAAEVSAAQNAAEAARGRAVAAADTVAATDAEAVASWRELAGLVGLRARRKLGPVPEPAGASTVDEPPALPLRRVAAALDVAREGGPSRPVPGLVLALLPLLGLASSAIGLVALRIVFALIGERQVLLNVLGQVLVFLAPFAGLPVLAALTRRWYGSQPDIGAVGLTVLGGMVASCTIMVTCR
jgi:hypothetical protein